MKNLSSACLWSAAAIAVLALASRKSKQPRTGVRKMASTALIVYTAPVVPFNAAESRRRFRKRRAPVGCSETVSLKAVRLERELPSVPSDQYDDTNVTFPSTTKQ